MLLYKNKRAFSITINERNRKLGTEITEGKAYKYQNKFNNSDNNNYVQRINVDLRVSNYERKYRRLVKKLNVWTHQIKMLMFL